MAWSDVIDGIDRCRQWHGVLQSMVCDDAIDGMGRCLRWYWTMPSMVSGDAIDGMVDAIDGCAKRGRDAG